MDNITGKKDGAATHIWLRHAVQFTVGERTHTIEMEVPVPIGASTEEWERLVREAEARMQQLASRVEGHAGQSTPRNIPAQNVAPPAPARPPLPASKTATSPAVPATSVPLPTPATPPTREVTQTPSSEKKETATPSTPPRSIGASMPGTTAIPGDNGDSLKLPQFIQYVKEALGLTPKQAMELLNIKTLSGL